MGAIPASPTGLHTAEEAARARAVTQSLGGLGAAADAAVHPQKIARPGGYPMVGAGAMQTDWPQTLRILGKKCGAEARDGRKVVLGAGVGLPRREILRGV